MELAALFPVAPPRFGLAGYTRKDGKGRESFALVPSFLASHFKNRRRRDCGGGSGVRNSRTMRDLLMELETVGQ